MMKLRTPRRALALAAATMMTSSPACGTPERLRPESEGILDLREVSGLATGVLPGFGPVVLAIGDEANTLTIVPIVDGAPVTSRAEVVSLPLTVDKGGSQLEAVAIANGHVFVLSEGPRAALSEIAVAPGAARLVRTGPLVVASDHPLSSAWEADDNALGEGLAFIEDQVLVAKQKNPAAIIAFRFDGGRWLAGATWKVDLHEISDLARGPDGDLYTIGASDGVVCRLAPLPSLGGDVATVARWALPDELGQGSPQWEGLAFLPDGRPIVAVDRKKTETPNFAILPLLPILPAPAKLP